MSSKTYLIYYNFKHTSGNHAGMAYLANYIQKNDKNTILIKNISQQYKGGRYLSFISAIFLSFYLILKLKKGDKIFFFEYLTKDFAFQDLTAKILKRFNCQNKILALVHLSGKNLIELYAKEDVILNKLNLCDEVYVFGSSLEQYLREIGFKKKIVTTFHYVDADYYTAGSKKDSDIELNVVCMGSIKRNFDKLTKIIERCPDVQFHVCMGNADLRPLLEKFRNVKLYGFLSESELLKLMQFCNISLSVLDDTIGSNVVTTSFAAGLVQVVSDVGSIRDYCDTEDSFLCSDTDDFINALKRLKEDKKLLIQMCANALAKSRQFTKERFLEEFMVFTKA